MANSREHRSNGTSANNDIHQHLVSEARLSRLHSLFKSQFNVTEPSMILEPYLFLGNCISAQDINRLNSLGIRYVLNVAIRDVEVCPYYTSDMKTLSIDLRDDDRENILRAFEQAFDFIDEAKRNKSRVLVHCSHGQSRSPAIVIGYLMYAYDVSLEQCLIHVIKARPCVLPNDGFLKQLMLFDRFLVDRRRRRAQAAAEKMVSTASVQEIPVQQHPVTNSMNSSQNPIDEAPDVPKLPTDNTSNPESVSTTIIDSSASTDSIYMIPIQISRKKSRREKNDSASNKKTSTSEKRVVEENKTTNSNSQQTSSKSKIERYTSNRSDCAKPQQNNFITTIIGVSSSHARRSHSAHPTHSRTSHYSSPPRKVLHYYPPNSQTTYERPRTKYITEIYDRATNRFIPTKC